VVSLHEVRTLNTSLNTEQLARGAVTLHAALAKEIRRRERVKNYRSIADDPKSPFHDLWTPAPFKTFYGGRGAAKDWSFAEVLVKRAVRESMLVLCTREYQNSIADSVHRVLKGTIHRLGTEEKYHITDKSIKVPETGSEFIFKGLHHNSEEIKSTEGVKVTWVAEGQNTTEDSWKNLLPTVFRLPDSELWVSFNVTDENAATHRRFVTNAPPGSIVHKVNYTENPYFPELLRRLMEIDKTNDYEVYRHIWLGHSRRISNAIILGGRYRVEEFSGDLWKKAPRLHFGADFGFANDPATLVRFFPLDNKFCKELGLIKKDDPNQNSDRLYVEYEAGGVGIEIDELEEMYDSVPLSRDWPIRADNARPETISYLRRKGFNIDAAEKWPGSVEDGIAHLRSHIIIIHPRCVQTESEAGTYSYKVDQKTIDPKTNAPAVLPIILDSNNHYIDGIRYGLDGHIQRRGALGTWAKLGKGR
jgi:phage terminase large subunit